MIPRNIILKAIEDYTEAVEKYRESEDYRYVLGLKVNCGLCFYFSERHNVTYDKTRSLILWEEWPYPSMDSSMEHNIEALTVRLNFLKEKLKEME